MGGGTSIISRFHVSADSSVADPAEQVLLAVPQPYDNHNGGMVTFGPDGYLYIGLGDGGDGGDPQGHGQDLTDLLGSLLRVDVSGAGAYAIPPDNPWAMTSTHAPEPWNNRLRTPQRYRLPPPAGRLDLAAAGRQPAP